MADKSFTLAKDVTIGHVVSVGLIVVSLVGGWVTLQNNLMELGEDVEMVTSLVLTYNKEAGEYQKNTASILSEITIQLSELSVSSKGYADSLAALDEQERTLSMSVADNKRLLEVHEAAPAKSAHGE